MRICTSNNIIEIEKRSQTLQHPARHIRIVPQPQFKTSYNDSFAPDLLALKNKKKTRLIFPNLILLLSATKAVIQDLSANPDIITVNQNSHGTRNVYM